MNFIEDEIPSENKSVNCVKSLEITNSNKLLSDKGKVRLSDVESFRNYGANEHRSSQKHDLYRPVMQSNCKNRNLDDGQRIRLSSLNPRVNRMSECQNSRKKRRTLESKNILTYLWKNLESKEKENISFRDWYDKFCKELSLLHED